MRVRLVRTVVLGLALFALAGTSAACTAAGVEEKSILDQEKLVIGTKPDQPGVGLDKGNGRFVGFDVDVAKYIARKLGYGEKDIRFIGTTSDVREEVLQTGKADLVVATYSIRPDRKTKVTFAGPYYVAHQDIVVRKGNTSIENVQDLAGRRTCNTAGTGSWKRVTEEKNVDTLGVEVGGWAECIELLKAGKVAAASTDDIILAGFLRKGDSGLKFVNAPFTEERLGVGVPKGDVLACEEINEAITDMYLDGTAEELLRKWFGRTSLKITTSVPQFEGCQ